MNKSKRHLTTKLFYIKPQLISMWYIKEDQARTDMYRNVLNISVIGFINSKSFSLHFYEPGK